MGDRSLEPTRDPYCFIEERGTTEEGVPFVQYVVPSTGERWRVFGTCICCGECVSGSNDPDIVWTGLPLGWPMAAYDSAYGSPDRLDVPMRPHARHREKNPHCTLWGEVV